MRARLDPPPGVTRARSPGCRCSRPRPTHALPRPAAAAGLTLARRAARGRRSCCCSRSTGAWARALGAARADRARHRLVGARAVRCCGVPLNPMSATLGALVIAISTEFSVLLVGALPRGARGRLRAGARRCARTYALDRRGRARLRRRPRSPASPCWSLSDVAMLRDFGLVTVVDLSVSLLGVLAVLPAVLVLAERRGGRPPRAARRRRAAVGVKRPRPARRRAGVARRSPTSRSTRSRTEAPGSRGLQAGRRSCRRSRCRCASRRDAATRTTPTRAAGATGVRGARAGRPELVRAGRARPGRARVRRQPRRRAASDQVDVLERVARALPGRPVRGRRGPRRPRRAARARARARLAAAGRLRPRRRGRQRLRGRGLPDDHVRATRRRGRGHDVRRQDEAALAPAVEAL